MKDRNKNLNELLLQFMDEPHAHQMQDDLSYVDDLFEQHPVHALEVKSLNTVKQRVHRKLKQQRYWITVRWSAAAVAVVVIALMAGLHILYPPVQTGTDTKQIVYVDHDQLWTDTLYAVSMETDPIERELDELAESLQLNNTNIEMYEPVNTMSIDLLEIEEIEALAESTNFWKG